MSPTPNIFLSALGSLERQREVDYGLNLPLVKAAKEAGVKVYVLISSASASANSMSPLLKLKAEVEEAVKDLGFPHTIPVRPGLLLGDRNETRLTGAVFQIVAKGKGAISKGRLKDCWPQDVDVIGKAAVAAGIQCLESKREEGVWLTRAGKSGKSNNEQIQSIIVVTKYFGEHSLLHVAAVLLFSRWATAPKSSIYPATFRLGPTAFS